MGWSVDFFDRAVMREFQRWPVSIRAKFTWIVNLIETHGPMAVGMPHVKSFGKELFEKRERRYRSGNFLFNKWSAGNYIKWVY